MSNHPLNYDLEVLGFVLRVREVKGTEELSRAFRLELKFVLDPQSMVGSPEAFEPDRLIKQTAVVLLHRDGVPVRRITGVITEIELEATITGDPEVVVIVEPRFALLRERIDIRNHREMSAPEIVTEVCQALGVKVENRLQESYPTRPYSVEWRESDFDYCNRLLEDEGIYYYFREGDVLVLGDAPKGYEPLLGNPAMPFHFVAGLNLNEDAVYELGTRAAVTPGLVTLRDWNTEHPSLDMDVSSPCAFKSGPEWYDSPGEYEEPGEGSRKAKLHAEAFDREAAATVGKSTSGLLLPGGVFTIYGSPEGAEDGAFVVRKLVHAWKRDTTGFANAFEADRALVTYRPPHRTYVPRIMNPHTGIVCTNGEDIQCDHFGRVKVHFHWDRLRAYDDGCSHWIPALQDNTGGSSAIPRKDWEVVVQFLEGDPDRPIVLGRVYNGDDVFQEKLPYAKDRSSLTSKTSPSRDTGNEIRFEDAAGAERVLVRASKDQTIHVGHDQTSGIGAGDILTVGNDEMIRIGENSKWHIGADMVLSVQNDQSWEVKGDREMTIRKGDINAVGGDHTLEITGNYEQTVFSDAGCQANTLKETLKGGLTEKYKEKHTTWIAGPLALIVDADFLQTAKAGKSEATTKNATEKITGTHAMTTHSEFKTRCDTTRRTKVEKSVDLLCCEGFTITGAKTLTMGAATQAFTADTSITLIVRDGPTGEASTNESWITLKDGVIELKAAGDVTIAISGPGTHGAGNSSQI
ncbi:MAG: type VI secretion system tip protein VgrG [Myxococcales bacterium]|nr:type VI secretion system tip protein VgrG [Myxococcales bacterium]